MKRIYGFPDGTFVCTENNMLQIERLKVGDKVLSQCEKTGERAYKCVTKVFEHAYEDNDGAFDTVNIFFRVPPEFTNLPVAEIHKIDGPIRGIDEETGEPYDYSTEINEDDGIRGLEVTPEHLIWVHDRGWTAARDIKPDDKLEIIDPVGSFNDPLFRPEKYQIDALAFAPERIQGTVIEVEPSFTCDVWNIEVEDFHTYFAGNAGVWVRDG